MKKKPTEKYIEKVELLTEKEQEKLFARIRTDLKSKMASGKLSLLEVAAIQLEIEADQVIEWRTKWASSPSLVKMEEIVSN